MIRVVKLPGDTYNTMKNKWDCLQGAAAVAQYLLAVFAEDPGFTPTIYNRTLQLFVIQVPGIQHPRLVLHAWVVNSLPTEPSF